VSVGCYERTLPEAIRRRRCVWTTRPTSQGPLMNRYCSPIKRGNPNTEAIKVPAPWFDTVVKTFKWGGKANRYLISICLTSATHPCSSVQRTSHALQFLSQMYPIFFDHGPLLGHILISDRIGFTTAALDQADLIYPQRRSHHGRSNF
jgi:hypothetical protein